jgi:N-acetylglucosamine kinase
MSVVLGLDSGGTKTLLAFANREGEVVALHRTNGLDPSANPGWPQSLRLLLEGAGEVVARAEASVLGLPFHDEVARYSEEQRSVARSLIAKNVLVQNDVRIAFNGAMAGKPGVLVLAGTGSMAWASLNGPGDPHFRVGGWGDAFGDEGSAFWIGREALAVMSRDLDGRAPAAEFSKGILSALGIEKDELLGWCYGLDNRRAGFARIAEIASSLAEAGNPEATAILLRAADHLAEHISTAWRLMKSDGSHLWSYAGGVLASRIVQKRIIDRVGFDPVPPRLPPVGGALLRAAVNAGWVVDDAWLDRLSASLATFVPAEVHHKEGE